jgi:hypothetical protein
MRIGTRDELDDIPGAMRQALEGQGEAFVVEMVTAYRAGDAATKADIRAFFESGGPEKIGKAKRALRREGRVR